MGTVNIRSRAVSDRWRDMETVFRPVTTFQKWVRLVKTYFRERNEVSHCNYEGANKCSFA